MWYIFGERRNCHPWHFQWGKSIMDYGIFRLRLTLSSTAPWLQRASVRKYQTTTGSWNKVLSLTDLSPSEFAYNNNFLALGVCFPQPCLSACRRVAAPRSPLQWHYSWRIVSFTTINSMKYIVNWISPTIRVRSWNLNTQVHMNTVSLWK